MTKAPILFIQNNCFADIGAAVVPALDWAHAREVDIVDRSYGSDFNPDLVTDWDEQPALVYGSVNWTKRCASSKLARWMSYDLKALDTASWAAIYQTQFLNFDGIALRAGDVAQELRRRGRVHVRPIVDHKAFTGAVYDAVGWCDLGLWNLETPVWVTPVKDILSEHRCWFVDGNLVHVQTYRANGRSARRHCLDRRVLDAAQTLAAFHLPMPTIVMDISEMPGSYKIIEFNSIHSSGWYSSNPDSVLSAWYNSLAIGE